MKASGIVKLNLSSKYNKKELEYRENIQQKEEEYDTFEKWCVRLQDGRVDYLKKIIKKLEFSGKILEIGAGSSWFSCQLSKLDSVEQVYCLDFSEKLMIEIVPKVMDLFKANKNKMKRIVGDFYNLDFPEASFDMVVVDAALHHIDDMNTALKEIKKVLKKDGRLVAIREPIIPLFRPSSRKNFGLHERSLGVTEKIYTKSEWTNFFEKSGFSIKFLSIIPEYNLKYKLINLFPFSYLNGYLFAHYIFLANKKL
ncbi:MAG TPA: class I SAM-dependent methyltransferase [Candidatus Nanoarchaeia archaeon]|nr:class I SAM-dependent methyltransferase [Candidatus Nanoarchaeia archaeon]